MVYVTRRATFNAAHRVYNPNLTDEENFKIFGGCSNPNWHGHNYILEVVVAGEVNPQTGYVLDLKYLMKIINKYVIEKVDHKNLNLEKRIPNGKLYSVKLYETENNYFEYKGD